MTEFTQNLQLAECPYTGEHRLKSIRNLLQRCRTPSAWVLYRPINEYTTSRAFYTKNSLTKQRRMNHNQSLFLARSLPWHRIDRVAICALGAPKSNRQQSWTIGCDYTGNSLAAERSSPSLGLGRSRQQLSSSPVLLISLLRLAFSTQP